MRRVAIVASHFVPSNLAAVHRARLWSQHLAEFGWEPTIVTAHFRHYREPIEPDLEQLLPEGLRVVRTPAFPALPFGILSDVGLRALPFHLRAVCRLAREQSLDFLHITIPSNYSALVGRLARNRCGLPYGIDYIDPWVNPWPGSEKRLSKAWVAFNLGRALEPWAVRQASLITGVAPRYYEGMLERNPGLRSKVVTAAMPYGYSDMDAALADRLSRTPFLFEPGDGKFHMVYAGAMLPKAYTVLERLLETIAVLAGESPAFARDFRLHFVGTGRSSTDPDGFNVMPLVRARGLEAIVDEHPQRVGYLDVLAHLRHASAVLVLGSTEPHYTPSKVFQALQFGRRLLAILHAESSAAEVLRLAGRGAVITFQEHELPAVSHLCSALAALVAGDVGTTWGADWTALERFSARSSARALAAALDEAMELEQQVRAEGS